MAYDLMPIVLACATRIPAAAVLAGIAWLCGGFLGTKSAFAEARSTSWPAFPRSEQPERLRWFLEALVAPVWL